MSDEDAILLELETFEYLTLVNPGVHETVQPACEEDLLCLLD